MDSVTLGCIFYVFYIYFFIGFYAIVFVGPCGVCR